MTKQLAYGQSPLLGLETCLDFHAELKVLGAKMQETWDSQTARHFFQDAWHLYQDWLPNDKIHRPTLATKKCAFKNIPTEMKLVLNVLRDLTNGNKHYILNAQSQAKRAVTSIHSGEIKSWRSWLFEESIPGVSSGNHYFSIRQLRDFTLDYFDWVFDDSRPVKPFPGDLHGRIWYCNFQNRDPHVVPPHGAVIPAGDPNAVRRSVRTTP